MLRVRLLPVALLLATAACDDNPTAPNPDPPSATFAEDFSGQPNGMTPLGWIPAWGTEDQRWDVMNAPDGSGSVLVHVATLSSRRLLIWGEVGQVADVELVARVRTTAGGSTTQNRLVLRARGQPGEETAYTLDLWQGNLRIVRFLHGALDRLGALETVDWQPDRWYWLRFRAEGPHLYGRIWEEGAVEPAGWTIERRDVHIPESGAVGLGAFSAAGARHFDYVGAALGGGSAPRP